jgi:hypothetical protein
MILRRSTLSTLAVGAREEISVGRLFLRFRKLENARQLRGAPRAGADRRHKNATKFDHHFKALFINLVAHHQIATVKLFSSFALGKIGIPPDQRE